MTIPLTRGYFALVDDEDYADVSKHKWQAQPRATSPGQSYAKRGTATGGCIMMHRQILNAPAGVLVDHVNGNTLDNRRRNLRLCTASENQRNRPKPKRKASSNYKGVSWHAAKRKWLVTVGHLGKTNYLGYFQSESDAARAYNEAAKRLHGEFAYLNSV